MKKYLIALVFLVPLFVFAGGREVLQPICGVPVEVPKLPQVESIPVTPTIPFVSIPPSIPGQNSGGSSGGSSNCIHYWPNGQETGCWHDIQIIMRLLNGTPSTTVKIIPRRPATKPLPIPRQMYNPKSGGKG